MQIIFYFFFLNGASHYGLDDCECYCEWQCEWGREVNISEEAGV